MSKTRSKKFLINLTRKKGLPFLVSIKPVKQFERGKKFFEFCKTTLRLTLNESVWFLSFKFVRIDSFLIVQFEILKNQFSFV